MDFAALPPEINSARMYFGPGSGPMLAAATAWESLAAELQSTAAAYGHEVASLTDGLWLGAAALSMAAAAAAHMHWLTASAKQAQETAGQARMAAAAYEAAFLSTVPPAMISANRSHLMTLVATDILGQNSAAIAATEAQYAEMWARDATAMYAYAAASADASKLTPFASPAAVTNSHANSHALAGQADAVAHTGTSYATGTITILPQLISAIRSTLQNLASPLNSASTATPAAGSAGLLTRLGLNSPVAFLNPANTGLSVSALAGSLSASGTGSQVNMTLLGAAQELSDGEVQIMQRLEQLGSAAATATSASSAAMVSVDSGRAALIGGLSVPQGWVARAPAMLLATLTSPVTGKSVEGLADIPAGLLGAMGLAAATTPRRAVATPAGLYGAQRITASTPAGAAPPTVTPGVPLTGIAAQLYQLAGLRDLGILTDEEFTRQKTRLLDG